MKEILFHDLDLKKYNDVYFFTLRFLGYFLDVVVNTLDTLLKPHAFISITSIH